MQILAQMKRCFFYTPFSNGIITFGVLIILLLAAAAGYLIITTDLHKTMITNDLSVEDGIITVFSNLFSIGALLNILLLFGDYQNDIILFCLYKYYAWVVVICSLICTGMLVAIMRPTTAILESLDLVVQCYVILVIRSEVLQLNGKIDETDDDYLVSEDEQVVDTSDEDSLV